MTQDAATAPTDLASPRTGYRPWLDGLRAFAVFLVLLDHSNLFKQFHLGQTGVGIFFGLSGYLITGMLIDEFSASRRINLKRFYLRRLARLMPGVVLTVFVCSLLFLSLGRKREVFNGIFALTYTANYAAVFFNKHLSGFGHFWSLAVEEHFYLIWPIIISCIFINFKRDQAAWIIFSMCVLSIAWRLFLERITENQLLMYVGSIERTDSLLYGAIFAILTRGTWRPNRAAFATGLFALLLCAITPLGESGILASAALGFGGGIVAVSLDYNHCFGIRSILSKKPIVFIGLLSYSLYLWHLPIYQLTAIEFGTNLKATGISIATTVAVAYFSYTRFEIPARNIIREFIENRAANN